MQYVLPSFFLVITHSCLPVEYATDVCGLVFVDVLAGLPVLAGLDGLTDTAVFRNLVS